MLMLVALSILVLLVAGKDEFADGTHRYLSTPNGQIRGHKVSFTMGDSYSFLGIPYAKPPVGNLRFKKPQPAESWKGTIGDKMPPACIQYSQYPYPWYDNEPGKSEDCLYLNVWMPYVLKFKSYPVIFFIHGGGFSSGSNRMDYYNGIVYGSDFVSTTGRFADGTAGVMVVTINYRLGAFGFLTSGTDDAPGNVGIHDMLMALHWVRNNIHIFRGDPNRITLYGQGAGSIAISLMCVSPLAKGLFQRVIMSSGTFVSFKENHFHDNLLLSQRLAESVGCSLENKTLYENPEEVITCLRDVNATELAVVLNSFNPTTPIAFYPQYNDELFPSDPVQALKDGKVHDVDMIIGGAYSEGSYLLTSLYPDEFGVFGEKDSGGINKTFAKTILRNAFKSHSEPDEIVKYFLNQFKEDEYEIRRHTFTALGDDAIFCPLLYFAEKYGDHTGKVHFYVFDYRSTRMPWADWMESVHFNDAPNLFARPLEAKNTDTWQVMKVGAVAFGRIILFRHYLVDGVIETFLPVIWQPHHFSSSSHGYNLFNNRPGQDPQEEFNQLFLEFNPQKDNCQFLRKYHGF